jgi:CHASE3 domain sensor protein
MTDLTFEGRRSRLEAAVKAAEAAGNKFMAKNIRTALQELRDEYRKHPPYQDRSL